MNRNFVEDDIRLQLLKHIGNSSCHLTQRDCADYLGLSLGKTHYCLTELIKKGYVKATRFKNSRNKAAYAYVLTPQGIEEKLHLLMQFLRRTKNEYQMLEQEIAQLTQELGTHSTNDLPDRI
ncbi:MAG: MarR family EPS-associated transcriptional regulator [Deltaproteobacteria bacterium]|nr:MarR family EPS-associated transcriptional regulator [Deltaproteobacteria bacterium]